MFPPKPLDTLPLEVDAQKVEGLDAFRFMFPPPALLQKNKQASDWVDVRGLCWCA